jgi:hypothetical protein
MATRMQQRRGTAAQWTAANPTLAAGEIGFETDNNRFKIGDGATAWTALDYFANSAALSQLLGDAPELLNTLEELASAMNDDPQFFTTINNTIDTHTSATTNVHGIEDTSLLVDTDNLNESISTALSEHNSDTTSVHGIADTSLLATQSYADDAETDAIAAAGTAADTKIADAVAALTKSSVGLANVDNTSDADKPVSTATQTALDLKAPIAAPSFTGEANFESNVTIEGNLVVEGTTTTVNTSEVQIDDPIFYLSANQYDANTRDIGITGAYGTVGGDEEDHLHTGLVKDVTDGKWKLFSNAPHPVNNVVDFTSADYDTLKLGSLEATTVTPSSGVVFTDGTGISEPVEPIDDAPADWPDSVWKDGNDEAAAAFVSARTQLLTP